MTTNRTIEYLEAQIAPQTTGPAFEGREWEVTIIGASTRADLVMHEGREYVKSKNGRLYLCDALRESVPMWEGIQVFDNHLTDGEFKERGGMRSILSEGLGVLVEPRWNAKGRAIVATLKIVDEAAADKLKNYYEAGVMDTIGLSIDTIPKGAEAVVEGKRQPLITGFEKIFSLDLVAEPAAGGGFNRLIAATQQEAKMAFTAEQIQEIKGLIQEALAGGQEQDVSADAAPEEVAAEVEMAVEEVAAAAPPEAAPEEVAQAMANAAQDVADEIAGEAPAEEPAMEAVRKLECKYELRDKLDAAKLPAEARALVLEAYEGKVFEGPEVDRMVESVRKVAARADPSGRVRGVGRAPLTAGLNQDDNARNEFLRIAMGNMAYRALESIDVDYVQERVPEAYTAWVKGGRPRGDTRGLREWMYRFFPDVDIGRQMEAVTTSSMSSIVKSALNVMLAADFQARHQWWAPIVREEELDSIDAPTLVRTYGLTTLDVVEEGQAYTELPWEDAEETAAFVKRGNYVGVTLETMLLDKVNKIRAIPELLSDSYYNTLSARAAAVFTTNTAAGPVLGDTGALFNATAIASTGGHVNLLTTALSYASYRAARLAMMKQTSMALGAGEKLLIRPKYILVPVDLEMTAREILESEQEPDTANNRPNPVYQESEVIVVPTWTDSNNWGLVADPAQFPCIWALYYRGNRVPELFTADSETGGSMFTNDTFRYKVRMLTFRFSSTYDCLPVGDWRGVHKSNVT